MLTFLTAASLAINLMVLIILLMKNVEWRTEKRIWRALVLAVAENLEAVGKGEVGELRGRLKEIGDKISNSEVGGKLP